MSGGFVCLSPSYGFAVESSPVRVVQEIGAMLSNCVQHLAHIPIKQQHADGDGRYAVAYLAVGTDPHRPSGSAESHLRPAQLDIRDVAATDVDGPDRRNFLPLDVPRHQA